MCHSLLLINSLGVGGAEKVFTGLINEMNSKGLSFEVVSIVKKVEYSVHSDIPVKFLSRSNSLKMIKLPYYFFRFLLLCLFVKPTRVQSHLFWSNYINIICSFLLGYDSQVVHCVSFESKFKGISKLLHFFVCRILLKKAGLNVFKSIEMRDEYVRYFKINLDKTRVIYNPISNKIVDEKITKRKSDAINVAVLGRFHSSKRHLDLISVAKSLGSSIVFHCIGEGELYLKFKAVVREGGYNENFVFYGWLNNPIEVLDSVDVYLSCSESEGFPNALIEAMSRGLPVIHSDCKTGPKEILGNVLIDKKAYNVREFGITFSVGNIDAIVKIFNEILQGDIDINLMGESSIKRVRELSKNDSYGEYTSLLLGL